jgi:hypothetical protein
MSDGILPFSNFISAASRTAGVVARAWLRVRRRIARRRPRQTLAGLDWILRDIGVIRERDMGTGLEADPREAARQFWGP